MPQGSGEQPVKKDAINLREMASTVVKEWKIVACCIGLSLIVTIINLHLDYPMYTVQMQVTPVQGSSDQGASRVASLSSLAQLAGINPSVGGSASQFRLYVESLRSRDVAEDLAKDQDLMKSIFGNEWDKQSQTWREPKHSTIDFIQRSFMTALGFNRSQWTPPDGARLQEFLGYSIDVTQDVKTPFLVKVSVGSSNPQFGIKLLNALNQTADSHLRKKALQRATEYINYLSKALTTVTVAEHREAIMGALSEQEKFAMSASSSAPYAADLFDKPWASVEPIWPQPRQALIKAIMLGGLIGAAIVLTLRYLGIVAGEKIRRWVRVEKLPQFLRRPLRV